MRKVSRRMVGLSLMAAFVSAPLQATTDEELDRLIENIDESEPVAEECLNSVQALKDCFKSGRITAAQFKLYYKDVEKSERIRNATVYSQNHHLFSVPHRCSDDSLNATQAVKRMKWAKSCLPLQTSAVQEVIKNFLDKAAGKGRQQYFTFGYRVGVNEFQPTDTKGRRWRAPASDEAKLNADGSCVVPPKDWYVSSTCLSGCYTPEQNIETGTGLVRLIDAHEDQLAEVKTLSAHSSLEAPSFQTTEVEFFFDSLNETSHKILQIETDSGRRVRVTVEHPLVVSSGEVQRADALKVGDELVTDTGAFDPIVSIEEQDYFGKVYNVALNTRDPRENIVVSQGLLHGSSFYQNEGVEMLDRLIFRTQLDMQEIL